MFLVSNSYPEHLVSVTLKESWSRKILKAILKGIQQDVELVEENYHTVEVLRAPYVKGFSEGCRESLERLRQGLWP